MKRWLVLAMLLAGCSRPKPTTAQVDPALSTLIPADTTMVVAANLDSLKKTALYHKYLENRVIPQLDQLGKFTGIDPRKDLWIVPGGNHRLNAVQDQIWPRLDHLVACWPAP